MASNNDDHSPDLEAAASSSRTASTTRPFLKPPPPPPDISTTKIGSGISINPGPLHHHNAEFEDDDEQEEDTNLPTTIEETHLRRALAQRHLSMMAIAGSIGTGLFLGLGGAVQRGGPLGALLGYAAVGLVVCAVQCALGEVAALLPVTGSFVRHAEFLVDPAWGFAIGWNLVYGNLLSIPSEATAVVVLVRFWWEDVSAAWVIVVFVVLTVGVGMAFVRVFGEVEFVFAVVKIALVVFLIVLGLVTSLGGIPGTERIGFRYWRDPGPFVEYIATGDWGKFLGFWSVMTGAVFSFAGVESLAMAAAETQNPREAIPRACKRVFARIVIFYMLAVLVVGMLVRSDDERLDGSGSSVAQSPFVIAASQAGISAIPSVVNAIVITSAWSASNQALLAGTRVLYGLALKKQAPAIFLRTTPWGTPYVCVLLFTAFMFLSFMSLSEDAITVFWWLISLTAAGVLVSWSSILLNHIRLLQAMKRQGVETSRLPWHNWWTKYSSPAALCMCIIILLTSGFSVFTKGNWDPSTFVSAYLDIPLVLAAYLFWKIFRKTKIVSLREIPLEDAFSRADEYDPDELPDKRRRWIRTISWIWD
ncbi:amino acid permease-domain-containing protein [Chaetomium strumarium]|uniref:Amino acid permease-domain-containing protein n=1 Tax=Chaetomium strumarium TaxID=1170767 RepID=A0AAJ0M359_9PEZI|nr:amino acid permease-domain-containing protein [Chaetomium strumarium]